MCGYVCICVKVWEDVHMCVLECIYIYICTHVSCVCVLVHVYSGV